MAHQTLPLAPVNQNGTVNAEGGKTYTHDKDEDLRMCKGERVNEDIITILSFCTNITVA